MQMNGNELRARIKRLGLTIKAAAPLLGLSVPGLHHQLRGEVSVRRQTEMLLECVEKQPPSPPPVRRRRDPPSAAALVFALFAGGLPAYAAEPFDWDRYHARQDACREQDRIAAACVQGVEFCDELALRWAQRACSAFGPLGRGERR